MATQARPADGARSWRTRLRKLLHDLGADEWEEPPTGTSGHDRNDDTQGAQTSLDEVLREASEARRPRQGDGGAS